jgi:transposase InsO family protein
LGDALGVEHRLTTVNHPWTNGQVERTNRTIKEATVKRYYYQSHDHLKQHLHAFLMADNFAKRLKTLKGLTPYEYICKIWTNEPQVPRSKRRDQRGKAETCRDAPSDLPAL